MPASPALAGLTGWRRALVTVLVLIVAAYFTGVLAAIAVLNWCGISGCGPAGYGQTLSGRPWAWLAIALGGGPLAMAYRVLARRPRTGVLVLLWVLGSAALLAFVLSGA